MEDTWTSYVAIATTDLGNPWCDLNDRNVSISNNIGSYNKNVTEISWAKKKALQVWCPSGCIDM